MRGNVFRCGCEVIIEGVSVGSFESIVTNETRNDIANTCTIKLPIHAIGFKQGAATEERIRASLSKAMIKPGAHIQVYTWYHDTPELGQKFERVLQFEGFIREVRGGFPATLICEDNSFILRFGKISRDWKARTKLRDMVNFLLPISNKAFEEFRQRNGFLQPNDFTPLTFDQSNSAEVEFALQTFIQISPYDALLKLLKMFALYGYVDSGGKVYFGIGVKDKTKRTVSLSTNTNVIGRKIVPRNGLFENYQVEVNGIMADGTRYTKKLGDSQGEPQRYFSPLNTPQGIDQVAQSALARLKGERNKGQIMTLLYPDIHLFDYVQYTDTIFSELSGNYYVISRSFKGDIEGFSQTIGVTDELFVL